MVEMAPVPPYGKAGDEVELGEAWKRCMTTHGSGKKKPRFENTKRKIKEMVTRDEFDRILIWELGGREATKIAATR
jgi:hypothetical protein